MKYRITKLEFNKAILKQEQMLEHYEICAKLRDYIKTMENPDEIIEIDLDEDDEKESD